MAIHSIAMGFRDLNGHTMLYEAWHGIGINMSHEIARVLHIGIVRPAVS